MGFVAPTDAELVPWVGALVSRTVRCPTVVAIAVFLWATWKGLRRCALLNGFIGQYFGMIKVYGVVGVQMIDAVLNAYYCFKSPLMSWEFQ